MSTLRKLAAKASLLAVACTSFLTTSAQLYQHDYTSHHFDPTNDHWVENKAIYRDDATQQYYIAQTITDQGASQAWPHLTISVCDPDLNVLQAWEYFNGYSTIHMEAYDIDEMYGLEHLVVVGYYINEGTQSAPYVTSIDKNTGMVNWFHLFPQLDHLYAIKAGPDYSIVVGHRTLSAAEKIHQISGTSAVIMKLDRFGRVLWERDFEDDKNMASGYNITNVYNSLFDITNISDEEYVAVGITNNYISGNVNDIWDADALFIRIDEWGNVNGSDYLGNLMPLSPGGSQPIQYENGYGVTFDPTDNTIVVAGKRFDHPQTGISQICPSPEPWGLWLTKIDPWGMAPIWSKQYIAPGTDPWSGNYVYSVDPEIDHDGTGQYGVVYNLIHATGAPYLHHLPVVTKVDNNGSIVYSRHHYQIDGIGEIDNVIFRDITRSFDFNNIIGVGSFNTDVTGLYNEPWGWNVEAYDNIIDHCLMDEFPVHEEDRHYEIGHVEFKQNLNQHAEEPMDMQPIPMTLQDPCPKQFVSMKQSGGNQPAVTTQVLQDETTRNLIVKVNENKIGSNAASATAEKYNIVLINTMGQRILQTESFTGSYKINVSNVAAGIYYLQVYNGSFREVHTISVR